MKRDYKETLKRYNFRKPRRYVGLNEQVGPISISNSKEDHQKDNLQQQQQSPLHQEEHTQEHIPNRVHIHNKKCTKRTSWHVMATNLHGKKMCTYQDDEVRYVFTPTK
jgi:hypothetical protein